MLKNYPLVEKEMAISQYSCLGNPMDREAWQVIVHGVAKESDQTTTASQCQLRNMEQNLPFTV